MSLAWTRREASGAIPLWLLALGVNAVVISVVPRLTFLVAGRRDGTEPIGPIRPIGSCWQRFGGASSIRRRGAGLHRHARARCYPSRGLYWSNWYSLSGRS